MYINFLVVAFLSFVQFSALSDTKHALSVSKSRLLSRRRRYVAFPEGSSFSAACCMTVGVIGQPAVHTNPGLYTFSLILATAYELPNSTETAALYNPLKYKQHLQKRINRRSLYGKLETIIDKMGYNGRECILRTLCESTQRLVPHGDNVLEEMFRILFTMPPAKVLPSEPLEHVIYDAAHRLGRLVESCDRFKCPISLVDLMKGYYNAPAPKVDVGRNPWALFSSNFG